MPEATVTTQRVYLSPNRKAVEVVGTLDNGDIVPGMYLHVPINGLLDFTVPVKQITPLTPPYVHIILDCGGEEEGANIVLAFNFEDEMLRVTEGGSD
jgi:hypothetical protein